MARLTRYRGKTIEELQALSLDEFVDLLPSKVRRSMKRMGVQEKTFMKSFRKKKDRNKPIRTHLRTAVVVPEMVGKRFQVYNGKQYVDVTIDLAMLGHRLGEFSNPVQLVRHSGPGIGATRGSKAVELK
ncbi:MAG: ribosomal protein S19 family protein [Candidatus Micrarchaeota archaeon]|nr:ribosomal protein S19 family protein [Candidatus Micrarchaeota archaeon]